MIGTFLHYERFHFDRSDYEPGPNWPLLVVLALSLSIWITGGVMVWWLI